MVALVYLAALVVPRLSPLPLPVALQDQVVAMVNCGDDHPLTLLEQWYLQPDPGTLLKPSWYVVVRVDLDN